MCESRGNGDTVFVVQGIPGRVLGLVEASGLGRNVLAQRVGLDGAKLSQSLSGDRPFVPPDLERIAEVFGVNVGWLIDGEEDALAVLAWRTTGAVRAAVKESNWYATARTNLAAFGYRQLWRSRGTAFSDGPYAQQGEELARVALRRVAATGRSTSDADLPAVIEDVFGVDVAVITVDEPFDGLKISLPDARIIVLGASLLPWRQRHTLAHELCHLLSPEDEEVHLDADVFDRVQGEELRANAFAAAFLMPEEMLRTAVDQTGLPAPAFAALACDLMVSPAALAARLDELRLLDVATCEGYKSITPAKAATIAKRGGEFAQSMARANAPRLPALLVRDAYLAYEAGTVTLRPYASFLGLDVDGLRDVLESTGRNQRD